MRAATAVWMIAAYPFALFYGAIYTESVFLLGAAGAFYHFRRRELVKAAAWGLLVGLTRPNGCFLVDSAGARGDRAVAAGAGWPAAVRDGVERDPRAADAAGARCRRLAAAAAPGIGVLLYSAYHLAAHRRSAGLGRRARRVGPRIPRPRRAGHRSLPLHLGRPGLYGYTSQLPADLLNGLGALFVLVAAWPVSRRLGLAYAVFILINILPPMAAGGLLSVGRFSSVLFPAFIWFADRRARRAIVPAGSAASWRCRRFNAALFYTWHELF